MAKYTKTQLGIVWDGMKSSYNSSHDEITAVKEFVAKNPFPEMKTIESIVPMQINAELSEINYKRCKLMYENIWDKVILEKCSKEIFDTGGSQALVQMYYLLYNFSPLCANITTRSFVRVMECTWDRATGGVLRA